MSQTQQKVVRCPNCDAAFNAASIPPGKGFRCTKCGTIIRGPAAGKDTTKTIRANGQALSSGRRAETGPRKSSRRMAAGSKGTNPVPFIVGGVLLLGVVIGVAVAMSGRKKPAPSPAPAPVTEAQAAVADSPPVDDDPADIKGWDPGGSETEIAKRRQAGYQGKLPQEVTGEPGTSDGPPGEKKDR